MALEQWSVIASVGTFVVISATALAAFVQLRHLRLSNQLAGLQAALEMLLDPTVREIVNYVRHDLAQRMKDGAFRESLLDIPVDRVRHPELYLCDMYNHVGSFVRNGLIDEDIYLQTEWYNVNLYWGLLRDVIAQTRGTARTCSRISNGWRRARKNGFRRTRTAIILRTNTGCLHPPK